MFKDAVRALDVGALPQVGLVAFFVAFLLVLVYVVRLSKRDRAAFKHLPLDDAPAPAGDGRAGAVPASVVPASAGAARRAPSRPAR